MLKRKKKWLGCLVAGGTLFLAGGGLTGNGLITAQAAPRYVTAINKGAHFISHDTQANRLNAWDALAIRRSPHGMTRGQRTTLNRQLKRQFKDLQGHYTAVDYERTLIGVLSVGGNPQRYQKVNLVKGVMKTAPKSNAGINGKIWGIIALSTKNYGHAETQKTRQLVTQVLRAQNTAGGWALAGKTSDVDITGMALMALGMHRNYPGVKAAINRANHLLKTQAYRPKTGDFIIAGAFTNKGNANSNAMAIAGLSAVGINPETAYKGTGHVTPINRLLAFQKATGQYRWLLNNDKGALTMATQQATYALEQYHYARLNKGSIFKF